MTRSAPTSTGSPIAIDDINPAFDDAMLKGWQVVSQYPTLLLLSPFWRRNNDKHDLTVRDLATSEDHSPQLLINSPSHELLAAPG